MIHGQDEFSIPLDGAIYEKTQALPTVPANLEGEEAYRWWLKNVYRGDKMRQFSVRAILSGMLIGGVMSVSNLYVGLKTGWGLGVTITACIIAYAVFKSLEAIIPAYRKDPFTILENCTMTSAASAAGYLSTAGLVSSIPALYLTTGRPLAAWEMIVWLISTTTLGVFMVVPLKRQLINIEQLPFPSGTATAATLKGLHTKGGKAVQQAKALFICAVVSSALKIWVDAWAPIMKWLGHKLARPQLGESLANYALPDTFPLFPGKLARNLMDYYTIGCEGSVILMAAGAIMGIRVGVSLLVGTVFFYGILAPILEAYKVIEIIPGGSAFRSISAGWVLWPAVGLMVTAALTSFALRWRTIIRAFSGLTSIFNQSAKKDNLSARVEIPTWWFLVGIGLAGSSCVILGYILFDIRWWMSVLAVGITFILSIVAARATGETDITPISAMGKITQLTYGVIAPSNTTTNLMTASITAGASAQSADLLTDLKAGYLLGASPRWQTIAQLFGVIAGALVCVPIYTIIVKTPAFNPDAPGAQSATLDTKTETSSGGMPISSSQTSGNHESPDEDLQTNLLTKEFPAPSAAVWKSVAELLAKGLKELPPGSMIGMIVGGILGIIISLAEEFLPRRYIKWIPSATGLGIAGIIPAYNSISMFIGALAAWIWMKIHNKSGEDYIISGSSGLIAGESLTGVAINLWQAGPAIGSAIWRFFLGG
ncbi:MAG TPA: OPT family oligopeptide transporter [Thermoguttaceae bacterium]